MNDFFARLFDPTDFIPREKAQGWDQGLGWLHNGSDILIALAYFALALAVVFAYRRLRLSGRELVGLTVAGLLAVGTAHLLEAISFYTPLHRLTGLAKMVAAVASWAAVLVLVPVMPRLLARGASTALDPPDPDDQPRLRQYIVGILAAVMAVLVRLLLDPFLHHEFAFVLAILAVVATAGYGGLWPALVCLLVSYTGTVYLLLPPRNTFVVEGLSNQLGTGLFVFVGVGCALLGEAQRRARQSAEQNFRTVLTKQVELETEVERRKKIEEDLRLQAGDLAIAQRRTADTLALLDTFVHNTPVGLAFYDPELRYVLVNHYLANANRLPVEAHLGRPITEVVPDLPPTVEGDLRSVLETGRPVVREQVRPNRSTGEVYRAGYYPVRSADGSLIGVGAVVEDVTESVRAEQALKASERRFRELAESMPQLVWTCRADGACDYLSKQWEQYTGRPSEEQLGYGWAEALHPDDREAAAAKWQDAVAAGRVFETEYRIRRHDGQYRWFYTRAVPVYNASGAVEQWFGTNTDIHARKEAEEALLEREADLNDFFENGPVGLHLVGPDGTVLRANRAQLELLGYTPPEYVGHADREFHVDPAAADELLARLLRGETLENYEARLRSRDGSILDVLISASGLWKGGRFAHARCFTRDITDRKRAEDELRESEARFRTLADAAPIMVWEADPTGRFTYFNKAWLDFTGLTLEEEIRLGWAEGVHPEDLERGLNAFDEHLVTRSPYELEYRRLRRDGEYRWLLARGTPRFTPGGQFVGFIGACLDITDRRRAEEETRESNRRLQQLADAMPQIVWAARPDGHIDYFNERWYEFTGSLHDESGDAGWDAILHPEDRQPALDSWYTAVQTGLPYEAEYRFRDRLGVYRWFLGKALPARDENGRLVRWFGSCTDIHAQKTQSETLERLVEERTTELRRSNEELEKFAYVASHDLQEPLRKVQAFGDLLRTKHREALGPDGRDYLDRMTASASRMRQLIQDLLGYSRVGTKGQPFTPVDLNEVATGVLSDLSVRIEQSKGTVDVGLLPLVEADPTQMRQLLQNLIGNALKFHRSGVPPEVTVRGEIVPPESDSGTAVCRITVADNGIGFEEKYVDRIFQVFQRLHGRGEYEGTGVGLALCRKIAERHGGEITVRSRPGAGSTFTVTLPVRRPTPPTSP